MTALQARLLEPAIAIHALAASIALVVGLVVLLGRKGTPLHRVLGRAWVGAMIVAAAGAFWIDARTLGVQTPLGRFGPIHLLSVSMLLTLAYAIAAVRAGNVRGHRISIRCAFAGLLVAGLFTLAPGRTLHAWAVAMVS